MAVSPKQLTNLFKNELRKFEYAIDQELLKKSENESITKIRVYAPTGLTKLHADVLVPKYLAAGWENVIFGSMSARNESEYYLEFTSKNVSTPR